MTLRLFRWEFELKRLSASMEPGGRDSEERRHLLTSSGLTVDVQ